MNILVATAYRNIVGGIETYLQRLIPALLQRGHQVAGLFDHRLNPLLSAIDSPEAQLPVWYCEDLRETPSQWCELDQWSPDIVYSHGLTSLDVDQELQSRYPTVTYLHGYWGTCATGRKSHSFPSIQRCERKFGPGCVLLHYPRRCGGLNPLLAIQMYRSERSKHARLSQYRKVLVASEHMHSEFLRNGVRVDRLQLLRLPVDTPAVPPLEPSTPTGRLLFLGRLTNVKGADFLIRAIPAAQKRLGMPLSLTMAGDGPELERLKLLARRAGVAANFVGWVSGAEKLELIRNADLLVVPSLWPEPFGMVGVEAGRMGLPAAGFAVGGIPDWLIPRQTGELAPGDPPTVDGLADALVRALSDAVHYNQLRRGAFEFSLQFTLDRHLKELEAILSAECQSTRTSSAILPVGAYSEEKHG